MVVVRRHPVITFWVLAFALTWIVWVPRALGQGWAVTVGAAWTWMPAIAAVLTAALAGGGALRDLGRRLTRWRLAWWWYAIVLLGPAAFWAVVWAVTTLAGWSPGRPLAVEHGPAAAALLFVVLVLTDGLGEETGWRGFALPRMLDDLGPLVASLLLGMLWAAWHLPLIFTDGATLAGSSPWILLLELPAVAIVYTWVFEHTGGSVLPAILLHASMNLLTMSASVAGASDARVTGLVLALKWLVAVAVVAAWARVSGARTPRSAPAAR